MGRWRVSYGLSYPSHPHRLMVYHAFTNEVLTLINIPLTFLLAGLTSVYLKQRIHLDNKTFFMHKEQKN
jgi:hypothetical protein